MTALLSLIALFLSNLAVLEGGSDCLNESGQIQPCSAPVETDSGSGNDGASRSAPAKHISNGF